MPTFRKRRDGSISKVDNGRLVAFFSLDKIIIYRLVRHVFARWYLLSGLYDFFYSDLESAILSVYDKTGLVEFAKGLHESGVRLLGSGGTSKKIRDAGIPIE